MISQFTLLQRASLWTDVAHKLRKGHSISNLGKRNICNPTFQNFLVFTYFTAF